MTYTPDTLRALANGMQWDEECVSGGILGHADAWEAERQGWKRDYDVYRAKLEQTLVRLEAAERAALPGGSPAGAWELMRRKDEFADTLRQRLAAVEENFQSMRRLGCACGVITAEDLVEWDRLQALP